MVLPDLDSTSRQQYVDLRMMSNREAVLSIQHLAVGDAFVTPLLLPPWSKMLAVIRIPPDSIRIGFGLDSTATVNRGIDHVEVVRGAGALQLFGDMGGLGVVILTLSSKPK